ncbi:DNA-methyltransferase [Pseudomonas savastanoi]|uniref:DNA-methyltransferase n=1 Tax=Pseudomonas savastanoi TaxID=29438 RepID=UPI000708EBBC|nr:site-specific DNA-methyltransferase [Pseudomonas savastanoi]KWT04034.1 hypothetical protein AL047_25350 [Pseudomonas syringae pv. broussonetiae]
MTIKLMQGDCLELMGNLPDASIDLILTDPPYFKIKGEAWDNQWARAVNFLAWMDRVLAEFQRVLAPGGSIYLFASAKMASRVECLMAGRFRVLNHIVWVKPDAAGAEKGARAGKIRSYVPQTERIIFASKENPLGDALRTAMIEAGLSALDLNRKAFGRSTGLISLWLCDREAHGAFS